MSDENGPLAPSANLPVRILSSTSGLRLCFIKVMLQEPIKLPARCVRVPVVFMMPPSIVRLVMVARVELSHSIRSAAGESCKVARLPLRLEPTCDHIS